MSRNAELTPPLFVVDRDGWLATFESVAEAESYLESPDVEHDEYVGFDATGAELKFSVEEVDLTGASWWHRLRHQNPVQISQQERAPTGPHLHRLLSEVLGRHHGSSLDELVNEIVVRGPRVRYPRLSSALTAEIRRAARP
jgi:hypothetical protein